MFSSTMFLYVKQEKKYSRPRNVNKLLSVYYFIINYDIVFTLLHCFVVFDCVRKAVQFSFPSFKRSLHSEISYAPSDFLAL